MKRVVAFPKMAFIFLALFVFGFGSSMANEPAYEEGVKLVKQVWMDMKKNDLHALENIMGKGFQSAHSDGKVRNKTQELKLIEGLHLGNYKLENFVVSEEGPVLIVSYTVQVGETIDKERLGTKPALRMSIFLKTKEGWKWIAHNNFKVIK